jgi:predicted acyl esterase
MDAEFVDDNYIRVYQDVRGRNRSEGDFVMNRPIRGPLNKTDVDESTDAYDSIDWLVKNVPESNGRVGITGSSYVGFTALVATIDPHPALKRRAAEPDGGRLDGGRLVPQWRFSPDEFRLRHPHDYRRRRPPRRRRQRRRRLRDVSRRVGWRLRTQMRARQLPVRPEVAAEPGLHAVLVAPGRRHVV